MQRKGERNFNNDRQCNIRIAWPTLKLAKNKYLWKNECKRHIKLDLGLDVERKRKTLKLGDKLRVTFLFSVIGSEVNKIQF